ncbi:ABC transporter substrate-binding protein [Rubellimicrobium roseum]|uniref:ABC transporter substrate-binding protein n=1 Tax=Rubellimicrobium roseum TaxID=687525 RepID=A0A5C4NDI4_9RHOB|nr:ABC transporter substrate-binding protein [Rubellimicrobium roseum]TNC72172.1 ABC transporter substrate-binding protein [Rubellimicrobium roseum]
MRLLLGLLLLLCGPLRAEVTPPAAELVVYWSLDEALGAPLVEGFQARHPGVAVRAETLLTGEIHDRIVRETEAGRGTADLAFSSAMDLQVKLANDGYAQEAVTPATDGWPAWANWRDTAYALTFEPAVIVYHRPSFPEGPPDSRGALLAWLKAQAAPAGIGTYDVERAGVGYLLLARDAEHFRDIWPLLGAMGRAGVETFPTTREVLERVADGRLRLGYNVLGSYAADLARERPDLGIVVPRDYVVVASRVALVPRAARSPDLGTAFLAWLMSPEGQEVLADRLRLPAVSLEVAGHADTAAMREALGARLRPVPVSPGLLAYLDRSRRDGMIERWRAALAGK